MSLKIVPRAIAATTPCLRPMAALTLFTLSLGSCSPSREGCSKDTDCKGHRICDESGRCVEGAVPPGGAAEPGSPAASTMGTAQRPPAASATSSASAGPGSERPSKLLIDFSEPPMLGSTTTVTTETRLAAWHLIGGGRRFGEQSSVCDKGDDSAVTLTLDAVVRGAITAPGAVEELWFVSSLPCEVGNPAFADSNFAIVSGDRVVAYGPSAPARWAALAEDMDGDGTIDVIIGTGGTHQGYTNSIASIVSHAGGKQKVLRDLGTVSTDDCGAAVDGGTEKVAVFFLPTRTIEGLSQKNYWHRCGETKQFRPLSAATLEVQ